MGEHPAAQRSATASPAVLPGLALAVAVLVAGLSLASFLVDEAAAAETTYLTLVAALVLAAAAGAAPRPAREVILGAPLAVLVLWSVPPGPTRGACLSLLLTAVFLLAAGRRLAALQQEELTGTPGPSLARLLRLAAAFFPIVLGTQVLLRGERWLGPLTDVRALTSLLAEPLAVTLAAALLAHREGVGKGVAAVATALLLAPGANVAASLSLLALAAGREAFARDNSRPVRLAALALLVAPLAWQQRAGLVAAGAGLALGGGPAFAAGGAAVGFALGLFAPLRSLPEAAALLALAAVILPGLAWPDRRQLPRWGAALALLWAAARAVPGPAALAAPVALLALSLPSRGSAAGTQRAWTGTLFLGTCLLAAYPWLHPEALQAALRLAGVETRWPFAGAALGAFCAAAFLSRDRPAGRGGGSAWRQPAWWVVGAAGVAVALALPRPGLVTLEEPLSLSRASPRQGWWLEAAPAAELILDTRLTHAADLPAGAPALTLRLLDDAGREHVHRLRVDRDTGEWAARRPDVAARRPEGALPPGLSLWRGKLPPGGGFLAQTYRGVWRLPGPARAVRLDLERASSLPPEVGVEVMRLEIRP